MFRKNHYSNLISVIIIGFVSGLFILKFSEIYLHKAWIAVPLYLLFFFLLIFFLDRSGIENIKFINKKLLAVIVALIVFDAFAWVTFLPRLGNIGRLPAINAWLDRFFDMQFPYNAPGESSGFPFLYIISIPFYLIKNLGYLETAGLLLMGIYIIYFSRNSKEGLFRLFLLVISPVIYFSLAARSEFFFNVTLIIGAIFLVEKYKQSEKVDHRFFIAAVVTGLAVSTVSASFIVFTIYSFYAFRNDIKKLILFIISVSAVFIITLIPFLFWNFAAFWSNGPFASGSFLSQIPLWVLFIWLVISIYLGWSVSDLREVFFASGILLFLSAFTWMIYRVVELGFYLAIIYQGFDLSYFVFCVPFFVLAVSDYKVDKFLNRIDPD